jgi:outer membrane biosynthesis protein TonB
LFAARSLSEIEITKMALHRDIFWVGKQWAVTGYGMQAVDQKQKSKFDIEASRLWEDDLLENLSEQRWFNAEDFNAGLSVARAKYPEAPGKAALRKKAAVKESAPAPVAPLKPEPKIESKVTAKAEPKADVKAKPTKSAPAAEPAKPTPKVESPKPESAKPEAAKPQPAPAPSKLSFTGGSTAATLKIGSKARAKKRPPAQFNIRIDGWPAKFTRMWRVRINQQ